MTKSANSTLTYLVLLACLAAANVGHSQTYTTLMNFNGADGAEPMYGSLVQGRDGDLYGTTSAGGSCTKLSGGCGTFFRMTRAGALTTLYQFCVSDPSCPDGVKPVGVALGTDGNFYGTTEFGGASNAGGTVFKMTSDGKLTTLHSFCSRSDCTDGQAPLMVTQARDGNLYGTTLSGGSINQDCGTVFELTPSGKLTTLHIFNYYDGCNPHGPILQARDGNFYGTVYYDIHSDCNDDIMPGCGYLFKVTPAGAYSIFHAFHCTDGANPTGGLIQGNDGYIYGSTANGGVPKGVCRYNDDAPYYGGTVFRVSTDGTLTTLSTAVNAILYSLVEANDGNLYGTSWTEGEVLNSVIFKMTPTGAATTLYTWGMYQHGPDAGLLQATNGVFYGTTLDDGANSLGTVYSLSSGLGPFVALVRNAGRVGAQIQVLGQGFKGTTAVSLNGVPASFKVVCDTYLTATVPAGAGAGFVTVTTPNGTLKSSAKYWVIP
jgi:uncharacterized repeat protein (TIGR03803 family)